VAFSRVNFNTRKASELDTEVGPCTFVQLRTFDDKECRGGSMQFKSIVSVSQTHNMQSVGQFEVRA